MNLLKLIQTYFWALKYKVPFVKNDVWYNYSFYNKNAYPKVFDEHGKYIPIDRERLYVLSELKNGKKAYYKIVNIHKTRGGDWNFDSDAYRLDFALHSIL